MRDVEQSRANSKTILVAEDEADILQMVRRFLESEGYRVVEATDGKEAVEVALRERPDLILMDLNMPALNGFEAARLIRRHPSFRDVPILANSAYGEHGMRFSLRDEELGPGFTFYFTKPFRLDDLKEMLVRLLPLG